MSAMGKCSLLVSVSLRLMQVFSCLWKRFYTCVVLVACSLTEGGEREREREGGRDKDRILTSFFFHV